MKIAYPAGATPLDPNELDGLILSVSTQGELNELEKANIRHGTEWAESSRFLRKELLTYPGLLRLHKALFGQVWEWAGVQRMTEKNIGVPAHRIPQDVHLLCEDAKFWIANKTYEWDEVGVRFHHRLVFIHPFVNGNGRLARIATDLVLLYNKRKPFTWGAQDLFVESELRKAYIAALKEADLGNYAPLAAFVRS